MILPNGLPGDSFYTGNADLSSEAAVGRIFLKNEDITTVKAYMADHNIVPAISPFDYFSNGYLTVNLLINSIGYSLTEKVKISPHMGDTFSVNYFGKSPISLQVTGEILNPHDDSHKAGMVSAYQHVLRLSKIAEYNISAYLSYLGSTVAGAMLTMNFSEQGAREGVIQISFEWLIFNITASSTVTSIDKDGNQVDTILVGEIGFAAPDPDPTAVGYSGVIL